MNTKYLTQLQFQLALVLPMLFFSSCNWFEYSPNQLILDEDNKNLTERNITKLQASAEKDSLRIAVTGDTQRHYEDTESFVDAVNARGDVDLVIHTGDITDFGLSQEFNWMGNLLNKLETPHFTVIGNHDFVAQGEHVYTEMYGAYNYSFGHSGVKFIFLNTNSREFNFNGQVPDLNWLESELENSNEFDLAVVVMHVPIFSQDFDSGLENEFLEVLSNSPTPVLTLNGHHHNYGSGELKNSGVPFINTDSVGKERFVLLDIKSGTFSHQIIEF